MSLISSFKRFFQGKKEIDPPKAYDLWAGAYDSQPGNLMLDMDEEIFSGFLNNTKINGKIVADIGCGTGRHWKKILQKGPKKLIGFDVSEGMLEKLKEKFPDAETYVLKDQKLEALADRSCDVLVSTLTIAHIRDMETALKEWNRVLKPGGIMIITDYHPEALTRGGKRTFRHGNKVIAVKNYIHPVEKIRLWSRQLGLNELRFTERIIDDSVKGYYEAQHALHLFEQFREVPIIYGIQLKKTDDPA